MQSCGQSVSARRGKRYTEIGLFVAGPTAVITSSPYSFSAASIARGSPVTRASRNMPALLSA